MKIATAWTTAPQSEAVSEAYSSLLEKLDAPPSLILVHCSPCYDMNIIAGILHKQAGEAAIHGGTSLGGVITNQGVHCRSGFGLGLMGISDQAGCYGTGTAKLGDNPKQAARTAVLNALEQAGRPGEVPQLILITAAPGCEEELLAGIGSVVGSEVPIIGGSSAGDDNLGQQLANDLAVTESVVLTVMFPSTDLLMAFHSGYEPTDKSGVVTRAAGHRLYEIDHRPAAHVYNEWSGGVIAGQLDCCGDIISQTTMKPIGRIAGHIASIPYYQLSHPGSTHADGSLSLFSEVTESETIILMQGTTDSLVARAGRVVSSALETHSAVADDVEGGLVIFCAGCMLAVQSRLEEVVDEIRTAMPGKPFLGVFTMGEQGCFIGGESRHGNLMISVLLFTRSSFTSLA
jgi:hypothetical protein